MTQRVLDNDPSKGRRPFDATSLKLDSLQYLLLEQWLVHYIVEVPYARLPLKTAYLFYLAYCDERGYPAVPIQAFNRTLTDVLRSRWPAARRRRAARGTLYENLTLRGWAPESESPPGMEEPSDCLAPCAA